LYYRAIIKDSLVTLDIDTKGNDRHFKNKDSSFELKMYTDVFNTEEMPNPKHIYFIAAAIKDIIDIMENRSTDDYYKFREIPKPADGK
jgi:hypothetical protein